MAGATLLLISAGGAINSGIVAISNQLIENAKILTPSSTDTASANYELRSNGTAWRITGGNATQISNEWLLAGLPSSFDVRATLQSGSTPLGSALATWLVLSQLREWHVERVVSSVGITQSILLVEIRDGVSLAVLATATITLTAEVVA